MTVIDMTRGGVSGSGDEYYQEVEKRLQARLNYIAQQAKIEIIDLDQVDLEMLESKVSERLEIPD